MIINPIKYEFASLSLAMATSCVSTLLLSINGSVNRFAGERSQVRDPEPDPCLLLLLIHPFCRNAPLFDNRKLGYY
jgi:hypothetical protein